MSETPGVPPEQNFSYKPPEPSRHGYWGPLPGESPELYRALGVPTLERIILTRVPKFWRGDFNMEAGRDLGVEVRPETIIPPAELTRQERLERFVSFTRRNEAAHIATFAALGTIGLCTFEGSWAGTSFAVLVGAVNVVMNLPPILVQRYNRLRAYRLLDRIGTSRSTATPE